jgi:hypothetical protein
MRALLILLFSFITYSADVFVDDDQGTTVLVSENCSVINEQILAIENWKKRLKEKDTAKSTPMCSCGVFDGVKECRADVTDILPSIVKDVNNNAPIVDGPNCWNASLVGAKILPHFRYTTPEEMHFWMESELCKKVSADEKPQAGDVIAIRNGSEEFHGFIYLSDQLSFSKNGYSRHSKYKVQRMNIVYNVYDLKDRECRHIDSRTSSIVKTFFGGCDGDIYSQIYRCKSWDEFVEQNDIDNEAKESWQAITNIECNLKETTFGGPLDFQQLQLIKVSVQSLEALADDMINKIKHDNRANNMLNNDSEKSKEELLAWEGIKHRAQGVKTQLEVGFYVY